MDEPFEPNPALFAQAPGRKPAGRGRDVPPPGNTCVSDRGDTHVLAHPLNDPELRTVRDWLLNLDGLENLVGDAVEDAMYYVLDGWRTHRFDLLDDRVDSDERRALGTKLQYHVLENLGLPKLKHPDTEILGIGVEIKGTIGSTWAIPTEGQCGVTLLIQLNLRTRTHKSRLMRTHRAWLNKPNKDGKRGIASVALADYSIDLYDRTQLRPNPLQLLDPDQLDVVFGSRGQEYRLEHFFVALPHVVVPRAVILTICANRDDPMRRVRAIKPAMRKCDSAMLCGKWVPERAAARRMGHDLTGAAWVAVPIEDALRAGLLLAEIMDDIKP